MNQLSLTTSGTLAVKMENLKVYRVAKYLEGRLFHSDYYDSLEWAERHYNDLADNVSTTKTNSWALKLEGMNIPLEKILLAYLNGTSWKNNSNTYSEYALALRELI